MPAPGGIFGITRPAKGTRRAHGHFREKGGFGRVNAAARFHPLPITENPPAPRDGPNTEAHIHDPNSLPMRRARRTQQQDLALRLWHGLVQNGAIQ